MGTNEAGNVKDEKRQTQGIELTVPPLKEICASTVA